jgi:hypothetical protein
MNSPVFRTPNGPVLLRDAGLITFADTFVSGANRWTASQPTGAASHSPVRARADGGPSEGPAVLGYALPQAVVGRTCRLPRAAPPRSSISPKTAPAPTRASPQSNVLGAGTIALSLPARTAVWSP